MIYTIPVTKIGSKVSYSADNYESGVNTILRFIDGRAILTSISSSHTFALADEWHVHYINRSQHITKNKSRWHMIWSGWKECGQGQRAIRARSTEATHTKTVQPGYQTNGPSQDTPLESIFPLCSVRLPWFSASTDHYRKRGRRIQD